MAKRVWIWTFATLLLAGLIATWGTSLPAVHLRSRHAQPAQIRVDQTVWVSKGGKLFHQADCKDLRQPAEAMPASEAIAKGYAPCTRCMRKALGE
jgi:hypothetical protein